MTNRPVAGGLRLLAEEPEDLAVISAAVQDGLVAMADAQWLKARRRFSLQFQRYCHERTPVAGAKHGQRVWSVLAFEGVTAVRARKVAQARPAAFASILSVSFEAGEAPSGTVTLTLADDGAIALDVECIDAVLADLGEARPALAR
ncbi:MAG: DUF2948 family protein, partial [Hyphomonadaceae bacterium]|nr:DUF2948 family protein [Hyphomonadaceae bacterium]